jgi:hypothetical protein
VFDLLNMSQTVKTGSGRLTASSSSLAALNGAKTGFTEVALQSLDSPDDFCSRVTKVVRIK